MPLATIQKQVSTTCFINVSDVAQHEQSSDLIRGIGNPYGCEWGNMSWGHITSKDLVTWTRSPGPAAIQPSEEYDKDGVFTGCFDPHIADNSREGAQLRVFYSSVSHLPFHWSTPPYPRNAAGVSMATSSDGGATWVKSHKNPVLRGEPDDIQVTGFRDPYISRWPAMDDARGIQHSAIYGVISGGIQDKGPTAFLYAIEGEDLSQWRYLGPLVDNIPCRFQPSEKWTGNYGLNWECTNIMSFTIGCGAASTEKHCLILGAEGDVERDHIRAHPRPSTLPPRTVRSLLWMFGDLSTSSHDQNDNEAHPRFQFTSGGFLDHGSLYAANSFVDPTGRRIMYGWIPEEDVPLEYCERRGWNGALAVPRELFLLCIPNVTGTLRTPLSEIRCCETVRRNGSSLDAYTLGIRPISELSTVRENCFSSEEFSHIALPKSDSMLTPLSVIYYPCWELEATICIAPTCCESVGFYIRQKTDPYTYFCVIFSTVEETISIDRGASTRDPNINTCPEKGPFTLFFKEDTSGPNMALEKLHLRAIWDSGILEVYANDRFVLTTMVYFRDHSTESEILAFATGEAQSAIFEEVKVWDGLNAMKRLFNDQDGGAEQ